MWDSYVGRLRSTEVRKLLVPGLPFDRRCYQFPTLASRDFHHVHLWSGFAQQRFWGCPRTNHPDLISGPQDSLNPDIRGVDKTRSVGTHCAVWGEFFRTSRLELGQTGRREGERLSPLAPLDMRKDLKVAPTIGTSICFRL